MPYTENFQNFLPCRHIRFLVCFDTSVSTFPMASLAAFFFFLCWCPCAWCVLCKMFLCSSPLPLSTSTNRRCLSKCVFLGCGAVLVRARAWLFLDALHFSLVVDVFHKLNIHGCYIRLRCGSPSPVCSAWEEQRRQIDKLSFWRSTDSLPQATLVLYFWCFFKIHVYFFWPVNTND